MLEAVDLAVVVPGAQGPHPIFQEFITSGRFQLAKAPPWRRLGTSCEPMA